MADKTLFELSRIRGYLPLTGFLYNPLEQESKRLRLDLTEREWRPLRQYQDHMMWSNGTSI
jgi:hypothetical protein